MINKRLSTFTSEFQSHDLPSIEDRIHIDVNLEWVFLFMNRSSIKHFKSKKINQRSFSLNVVAEILFRFLFDVMNVVRAVVVVGYLN